MAQQDLSKLVNHLSGFLTELGQLLGNTTSQTVTEEKPKNVKKTPVVTQPEELAPQSAPQPEIKVETPVVTQPKEPAPEIVEAPSFEVPAETTLDKEAAYKEFTKTVIEVMTKRPPDVRAAGVALIKAEGFPGNQVPPKDTIEVDVIVRLTEAFRKL